ncbi:MAG: zinc ribbon domain-containing protein [Clostridia bacterium]|nr:zinc ribbon domain-containing protein [Clostridia bacterium]
MFCPKCGANIADDSTFCGHCGCALTATAAPAAPVAPAAPAAVAPVAQSGLSAKKRGLSKKEFLSTEAAPGVRMAGKLSLAFFAVILVLILLATITVNTIAVVDLPIIKMAVDDSERDDLIDSVEVADETMEEMEELLEEIEDEFGSKAARQAKKVVNKWEKATRKLSLANLIGVVDATHSLANDVSDKLGMNEEIEALEEVSKILKIVRVVTYAVGIVIALLALWAATAKKTGLCVLGILLYVPACALLSSVLLAVLIFVAFVALAVCTSKVNKAWKKAAV